MVPQRLFDQIEPTNEAWRYTESNYELLSRAAGPPWDRVRDTLEAWFANYPDREELSKRFRQNDPRQHDAAWWELYTFTLFRQLGYSVEVHPPLAESSHRPDFLATRGSDRLYIECTVAFDSNNGAADDSEAWLKDCINAASSPDFGFSLRIDSAGSIRAQKADVIAQIENWVASLDYETERAISVADRRHRQSRTFVFANWRVTLTALPVPPDRRDNHGPRIVIGPTTSTWSPTTVANLKRRLGKKATQVSAVQAPLIIAVLSRKVFARTKEVDQALFGSETTTYVLDDDGSSARFAQFCRNTDGFWHPGPPPRRSRVSGVLFAEALSAAYVAARLPTLWVNPWAKSPLSEDLPFETRAANEVGEVVLGSEASASPHSIFDLPSGWPGLD